MRLPHPPLFQPSPTQISDNNTIIIVAGMAKPTSFPALATATLIIFCSLATVDATVFTLINKCKETVWPGILPGDTMLDGGFSLSSGDSKTLHPPTKWSGRLWGRTGCTFDASGKGSCQTGDCGGVLQCNGAGGDPPVSLVELTLDSANNGEDYYDVSLVDGYNLPVSAQPVKGSGNCTIAGNCNGDLREICPSELAVKVDNKVVACRSACDSFKTPEYCCTGAYANPQTCQATSYSKIFKKVCPTSYSYAFDDPSSLCRCEGSDYVITFCPYRKNGKTKSSEGTKDNNKGIQSTQSLYQTLMFLFYLYSLTLFVLLID